MIKDTEIDNIIRNRHKKAPKYTDPTDHYRLKQKGLSATEVGKVLGISKQAVCQMLARHYDDYKRSNRPKDKEKIELAIIGDLARERIYKLLDNEKTNAIESTAIMDRSFNQRRLLEGESTTIIDLSADLKKELLELKEIQLKINELQKIEDDQNAIDITPVGSDITSECYENVTVTPHLIVNQRDNDHVESNNQ